MRLYTHAHTHTGKPKPKIKKKIAILGLIVIFLGLVTLTGMPKKIGQILNTKMASLFADKQDYLEINRDNMPKINVSLNSSKNTATVEITNYPSDAISKQYRIDTSRDWQDYTGKFTIKDNAIIQTRYKNAGDEQYTIGSSKAVIDIIPDLIGEIKIALSQDTPIIKAEGNVKEVTSDGVPIPKGFYYVGGKIDEGVVISDNASDAGKGTSFNVAQTLQGNQFVWVPVKSSRTIKTNITSKVEIQSIVVKNTTDGTTYNLNVNNQTTYTQNFSATSNGTYRFIVTDILGDVETKDITITELNGPIHWTHTNEDGTTHEVGQLWATSPGDAFGVKNTRYLASAGFKEPDVVTEYEGEKYDGYKTYLKTALGVSTDDELKTALGLTSVSNTTNNANAFKKILQKEFDQMCQSVDKYGGFYIGRYETGGFDTNQCVVKPGQGDYSINRVNWYEMYNKTKTLSTTSVASTLIWGCQYDAMCWWIGDYTRTKSSDDTRTSYSSVKTGSIASDVSKNIYDLAGNVLEWTMESVSTYGRVQRGGYYAGATTRSVSFRYNPVNPAKRTF